MTTTTDLRELARLTADDDFRAARMTPPQYAELCRVACRAELARGREKGLELTRDAYAELYAELYATVALAGLDRAQSIDRAAGMEWTARDGYAPRWVGIYAEQYAEQTSGAEFSTLHGAERAQLARNRWVQWLRFAARHELTELRDRAAAETGDDACGDAAERMPAARLATAERAAEHLSARLSAAGRPLGKLETAAIAGALSGLTHAQRAELTGSTADACKTYAAKGRKLLRARWITADAARDDFRAADRAADRAELYAAACRMAPLGPLSDAAMVTTTRIAAERAERAELREQSRAIARKNAERGTSGHAGGTVRTIVHVPADGDGTREQSSRVEAGGRSAVSFAVHRGHAPRYVRAPLIVLSLSHRARMARVARTEQRAAWTALRRVRIARELRAAELRAA